MDAFTPADAAIAAGTAVLTALVALGLRAAARALTGPTQTATALGLTLLPLLFVAPGFLPGRTLTETGILGEHVPWRTGAFQEAVARGGPSNPLLADVVTIYEPWRKAARDGIAFFPGQLAGTALAGNGHSAALFPVEIAARVLPPASASAFVQAARLLIASWGFFVLMRVLGLGPRGALAGALVFAGSGYLELWRAHVNASAVALSPWLVAGAIRLLRRPGPVPAVVAGVAAGGVVLAGHPQSVASIGLLTALVVAPACERLRRRPAAAWSAAALLLAGLLAAPVALPFLQNLPVSAAWAQRRAEASGPSRSVYPDLSARLLLPSLHLLVFGDPRDGSWSGPGNLIEVGGGSVGTVALALVPAALAVRRRRRLSALWLAFGLGGLFVAAGLPVVGRLYDLVPGGSLVQQHRLTLFWAFAASALAAVGAENVLRGPGRRALVFGAAGMAVTLSALSVVFPVLVRPVVWAVEPVALAAAIVATSRRAVPLRPAFLAAGLLLPRVAFFATWIPAPPASTFYPETPAIRYVRDQAAGQRVAGLRHALLPASAAFFGLEDVRGYEPMALGSYVAFVSKLGSTADAIVPRLEELGHPALRFLGVRFVFAEPDAVPPPGWTVAWRGPDATVFEDARALPRLFVPRVIERAGSEAAAISRALSIDDPAERVVELVPGTRDGAGEVPNGPAKVSSLVVSRGRVEARLTGRQPSLVATSQPALPGWRVTVDGVVRPRAVVNGAFLGVRVGPGAHVVRFEYAPAAIPAGLVLGGAGLLLATVLAAGSRATSRGRQAAGYVSPRDASVSGR